ncbi:hypothetical protein BIU97_14335 [Curtobacterium sp. MCBA15_009]|nr:hypothetical protein BIU97_14335 [Curtobacterium sp. MCBA15_009]
MCVLVVTIALASTGCATIPAEPGRPSARTDVTLEHAGPWSDEFKAALDDGASDYEASILADGRITTEEVEGAHEQVRRCLADSSLGITYDPDGGFRLHPFDREVDEGFFGWSDPILRACEKRYDEYVTYLYEQTRRNPERLDDAEITVPCLRKAGLVGRDYTEQQWREDLDADTLPHFELDDKARQCMLDPLGLWRAP